MKKRKKKSKLEKSNSRYAMFIIFFLFILLGFIVLYNINNKELELPEVYCTGKLYSANQAANMLDYAYNQNNTLISPLNIYLQLDYFYNGTDNNSYKELKSFFNKNIKDTNEELSKKLSYLEEQPKIKNEFTEKYENYIKELIEKEYDLLTINKINSLENSKKEEIHLLTKKIILLYERINDDNNLTLEYITNYHLSEKERTHNSYEIKKYLDEVLDKYETYLIENKVNNYIEIYSNSLSNDTVLEEFNNQTSFSNINITNYQNNDSQETISDINNKIKLLTDNNINRIVDKDALKENDTIMISNLYFNYEWEELFLNSNISNSEFYDFKDHVSPVEMMYSQESLLLENNMATGFIKPFIDNKYSFIGILPKTKGEFNLSNLNIDSLISSQKKVNIIIGLPKFTFQSETDLINIFSNYNINEIYSNKANFTKITDKKFYISKHLQKNYISIGEKGTIPTNVKHSTNISTVFDDGNRQIIFNRPFAFLIINNESKDILLIGKVVKI